MTQQPLFDYASLGAEIVPPRKSRVVSVRNKKNKNVLGKRYQRCQEIVGSLQMGETIHYVSMGDWSLHDVVLHIIDHSGPAEVDIVIWSIAEDPVRLLLKNIEAGNITRLRMLLDWRVKVRRPEVMQLCRANIAEIKLSSCHAKMALVSNDKWAVAVIGSANLTNNPRIEAGVIACDREVLDFHRSWITAELAGATPFDK